MFDSLRLLNSQANKMKLQVENFKTLDHFNSSGFNFIKHGLFEIIFRKRLSASVDVCSR